MFICPLSICLGDKCLPHFEKHLLSEELPIQTFDDVFVSSSITIPLSQIISNSNDLIITPDKFKFAENATLTILPDPTIFLKHVNISVPNVIFHHPLYHTLAAEKTLCIGTLGECGEDDILVAGTDLSQYDVIKIVGDELDLSLLKPGSPLAFPPNTEILAKPLSLTYGNTQQTEFTFSSISLSDDKIAFSVPSQKTTITAPTIHIPIATLGNTVTENPNLIFGSETVSLQINTKGGTTDLTKTFPSLKDISLVTSYNFDSNSCGISLVSKDDSLQITLDQPQLFKFITPSKITFRFTAEAEPEPERKFTVSQTNVVAQLNFEIQAKSKIYFDGSFTSTIPEVKVSSSSGQIFCANPPLSLTSTSTLPIFQFDGDFTTFTGYNYLCLGGDISRFCGDFYPYSFVTEANKDDKYSKIIVLQSGQVPVSCVASSGALTLTSENVQIINGELTLILGETQFTTVSIQISNVIIEKPDGVTLSPISDFEGPLSAIPAELFTVNGNLKIHSLFSSFDVLSGIPGSWTALKLVPSSQSICSIDITETALIFNGNTMTCFAKESNSGKTVTIDCSDGVERKLWFSYHHSSPITISISKTYLLFDDSFISISPDTFITIGGTPVTTPYNVIYTNSNSFSAFTGFSLERAPSESVNWNPPNKFNPSIVCLALAKSFCPSSYPYLLESAVKPSDNLYFATTLTVSYSIFYDTNLFKLFDTAISSGTPYVSFENDASLYVDMKNFPGDVLNSFSCVSANVKMHNLPSKILSKTIEVSATIYQQIYSILGVNDLLSFALSFDPTQNQVFRLPEFSVPTNYHIQNQKSSSFLYIHFENSTTTTIGQCTVSSHSSTIAFQFANQVPIILSQNNLKTTTVDLTNVSSDILFDKSFDSFSEKLFSIDATKVSSVSSNNKALSFLENSDKIQRLDAPTNVEDWEPGKPYEKEFEGWIIALIVIVGILLITFVIVIVLDKMHIISVTQGPTVEGEYSA